MLLEIIKPTPLPHTQPERSLSYVFFLFSYSICYWKVGKDILFRGRVNLLLWDIPRGEFFMDGEVINYVLKPSSKFSSIPKSLVIGNGAIKGELNVREVFTSFIASIGKSIASTVTFFSA